MNGLFRSPREDSYVTDEEIAYEHIQESHRPATFVTELPQPQSFAYWSNRLKDRQRIYLETAKNPNVIEIKFDKPPLIALMSDLHVQAPETDYQRIEDEFMAIAETPNAFLWGLGDITDNFFWLPAGEDKLEPREEAIEYMKAGLKYLAERNKLLVMTAGNHDLWSMRNGLDPFKHISQELGAFYTHGDTYLYVNVQGIEYKLAGNHQWKGSSIYNNAHPQVRASREIQGCDVVIGGHYHQKGILQQPVREFGEHSRVVTHIALGTYKGSDEWTRTKGFSRRLPNEMYGSAIFLHGDRKEVTPFFGIVEACEEFRKWQS